MAKYNVLGQITQFFEIEADSAKEAEMKAFHYWRDGELSMDETALFVCEEADLIEEEEA